jgi:uncharacterized damage-inducible protein DinB
MGAYTRWRADCQTSSIDETSVHSSRACMARSITSCAPQKQLRREILAHLFNHQTHHRGQAHAILTLLGVREPDGLDLLLMQWERG